MSAEGLAQTDGGGGFAFSQGGGGDAGNADVFTTGSVFETVENGLYQDFGFGLAVELILGIQETEVLIGDDVDGKGGLGLSDVNVRWRGGFDGKRLFGHLGMGVIEIDSENG